jgi:CheY-like chemotaxis protein
VSQLTILTDIPDYSKLEAGQMQMERMSFSVRQVTNDVFSMLANAAGQKKLVLEADIAAETPAWIVGDPTRFRQILLNLVSNALKFTEAGSVTVVVRYTTGEAPHMVRVEVHDTGIGIPVEAVSRLFNRFSQADESTTRRFGGTGLGLAISRELVACMGGDINVRSEPGRGSVFTFEIPTEPGSEPEARALPAAHVPTGLRLNILVAEDNPVNQKVLRTLMNGQGHELTFVDNGQKAVDAAREGAFDLILMDVSMPVMDGPTAAKAIREFPQPAGATPIIALTANAMAGDRESYLARGMNDYVSKPIDLDLLLAAIARQAPGVAAEAGAPRGEVAQPGPTASDAAALSALNAELDDLLAGMGSFGGKREEAA